MSEQTLLNFATKVTAGLSGEKRRMDPVGTFGQVMRGILMAATVIGATPLMLSTARAAGDTLGSASNSVAEAAPVRHNVVAMKPGYPTNDIS